MARSTASSEPRSFLERDWYEQPRDYDIVFNADTRKEADFLEALAARHGLGRAFERGARVLEPACGSGRLVEELAARGQRVTGFDASASMLRYARERLARRGLRAKLVQARLEDFALRGPFELAHCLVSTFKYVLDETGARAHLAQVARALAPGGLYVLGFHLSDYADRRRTRERWQARRARVHVTCNIQSWPADRRTRLERVRSRLLVRGDGAPRRYETSWDFRTYDAAQFRRTLRSVPELEHLETFGFDYELARPLPFDGERLDCVLVLRKRR